MSQYGGSKYPILAQTKGPIEPYAKSVELATVNGVYLNYLVAATYKHNKSVYLVFDIALNASNVEVETINGGNIDNWTLSNIDVEGFKSFAREKGVVFSPETSIDELARKVLMSVNDRANVMVPAYRYQGVQKT
ncbi:MAG: hypothetical protein ACTH4U_19665 [Pseudoalteromonas prydzensis]|uniref:hypothetical protein n=1 Tax=Pseudoalteromonas prydzensis TaxID=182141 RepID=UPI003F9A10CB